MTSAVAKEFSASLVMMKSIFHHDQVPVLRPWPRPRFFLVGLLGACVEGCFHMLFDYIKNPSDVYEIITDRYSSLPVSIYQKSKCHRTSILNLPMTCFYCRFRLS
ncbi:uncharacterized protein BO88DRAFT_117197 [Aspergillus vadensis CBS 113365]|uniref:Uncharacterized protein n=1 Tax=Aspergillus vadensis (strain CBS 113365 / IMI 142717 / IBT 24658) TaxID=1448311 RepID=A0A319B3M8_ASPVC|nr:hypothetical protein BO88DRAFT_117197 [Aspergillus vadensis CBS 113365]PYH66384.1 hypothetical protein BO88DRAFT_117197 [Aspergillus vadensis CBS 113365]